MASNQKMTAEKAEIFGHTLHKLSEKEVRGMKTLAVIPARYASTRLPGKPLIPVGGIPLVIRVLDNVRKCRKVDRVIVAADDERIAEVVLREGGEVMMTPAELPSGGDRVAWAAERTPSDYVINVQVDDPRSEERREESDSPDIVKMVFDTKGRALYFSRSPIPYPRTRQGIWYKHIGPYAWRRSFLLDFSKWEQTPLEKRESLEMLRVLERGHSIRCIMTERDTIEIDTPNDLTRIGKYLSEP